MQLPEKLKHTRKKHYTYFKHIIRNPVHVNSEQQGHRSDCISVIFKMCSLICVFFFTDYSLAQWLELCSCNNRFPAKAQEYFQLCFTLLQLSCHKMGASTQEFCTFDIYVKTFFKPPILTYPAGLEGGKVSGPPVPPPLWIHACDSLIILAS